MAMAHLTDIGMIFVRCRGGLSHHPAEEVSPEDMEIGVEVLRSVVSSLAGLEPQSLRAAADGRRLPM
jgi:allantoate deiminase